MGHSEVNLKYKKVVVACLALLAGDAAAQTACPVGITPGSAVCGPTPVPRSGPAGHWVYTWGAIAIDPPSSAVGKSTGQATEDDARRTAINDCRTVGTTACEVYITYQHQCVALAWPEKPGKPVGINLGSSVQQASTRAGNDCRATGGGNCRIVYSECTAARFEKY